MGFYIEVPSNHGKAQLILTGHALTLDDSGLPAFAPAYEAEIIPQPASFADVPEDKGLICVVNSGLFEAAGYCYDEREFREFTDPEDTRPKEWLLIDRATAETCSGHWASSTGT